MTVLIVEDEALLQMEMEMELSDLRGFEVRAAYSMDEAEAALGEQVIDVACLDIMLHGRPAGIELAARLREQGIPFIFVSGSSDRRTLAQASELGPVAFVNKPVDYVHLAELLQKSA